MAQKGFFRETFENLPTGVRTGIVIGSIGISGYLIYKIYKALKVKVKAGKSSSQLKEEVQYGKAKGQGLSYLPAVYTQMADRLFAALDGYLSENEEEFKPVMAQMKTRADLAELIRVYGSRDISPWYGPMSLSEAVGRYFSESDIQDYIHGPLNRNGVDYSGLL